MKTVLILSFILASITSQACMVGSAQVKAITTGDFEFKNGACYVPILTEEVTNNRQCPLYLGVEEELVIRTTISEKDCHSLDEMSVKGTVSNGGSGYFFDGEIY